MYNIYCTIYIHNQGNIMCKLINLKLFAIDNLSFFQMQIRAGMVRACKPVVNLDLKADKYRWTTTGFFVGQKKRKERTGTH